MTQTNKIVILGAGSMTLELIDFINEINDSKQSKNEITDIIHNGKSDSRMDDINKLYGSDFNVSNNLNNIIDAESKKYVVSIANTRIKQKCLNELNQRKLELISIVHPSAHISEKTKIGKGVIISPNCYIGANAVIKDNSIINVNSIIGHDVEIGTSCIISPGAKILGGVHLGKSVFIGSGSIIHPKVSIGDFSRISLGSIIIKDIDAGLLAHGNPIKTVKLFHPQTGENLLKIKNNG